MLCGRRLLASQSPLPPWRTTATALVALTPPATALVALPQGATARASPGPSSTTGPLAGTQQGDHGGKHSALGRERKGQVLATRRPPRRSRKPHKSLGKAPKIPAGQSFRKYVDPTADDYNLEGKVGEKELKIKYYHSAPAPLPAKKPSRARTNPSEPGLNRQPDTDRPMVARHKGLADPRSRPEAAKDHTDHTKGQAGERPTSPLPSHRDPALARSKPYPFQIRKVWAPDKNIESKRRRFLLPVALDLNATDPRPPPPFKQSRGGSSRAQDDPSPEDTGLLSSINLVSGLGPDEWLRAVAHRLGIALPTRVENSDLKSAIARELGLSAWDDAAVRNLLDSNMRPQPLTASSFMPAQNIEPVTLANREQYRDRKRDQASARHTQLQYEGHSPLFAGRPSDSKLGQQRSKDSVADDRPKGDPASLASPLITIPKRPAKSARLDHDLSFTKLGSSPYFLPSFGLKDTRSDVDRDTQQSPQSLDKVSPVDNKPGREEESRKRSSRAVDRDLMATILGTDLKQSRFAERAARSASSLKEQNLTSLGTPAGPDEPLDPIRSIFEMLFPEEAEQEAEHKSRRSIAAYRSPPEQTRETVDDVDPRTKHFVDVSAKPPSSSTSIFKQLFPDGAASQLEATEKKPAEQPREPQDLPEDSLFISLRNEVRNWIPDEDRPDIEAPDPGEYGSQATVVVISGVSNSLVDTDFYRIIPEGKYVEGWAGGLIKVVQARDPLTYEPIGQYFLMFHSRPAATAYTEQVRWLHKLSKRLLHSPGASGDMPARGPLAAAPANPQPFLTDEEKAAVLSFTLYPPDAPLHISVRMWSTGTVGQIASKTNIADVVQALRPEAETPAAVLLRTDGGGLTAAELWLTLRDDGRERGAPWVLSNLREGIRPVRTRAVTGPDGRIRVTVQPVEASLEGGMFVEDGEDGWVRPPEMDPGSVQNQASPEAGTGADGAPAHSERSNRFVLTFKQRAIARRFVRCWHRRAMYDTELQKYVFVDVVALM